jgi:hypothetical protein
MERAAWTDERLNDLSRHVDTRFDCVDARFDRVDRDIRDLRTEMTGMRVEIAQRFEALQTTMIRFGGAMIICLLAAIMAFSLGGA